MNLKNLARVKDVLPKMQRSGIYEVRCQCGDRYIGQSGRTFQERYAEHRRDYLKLQKFPTSGLPGDATSSIARHFRIEGHSFDSTKIFPLHYCVKGRQMYRLEEYYTIKNFIDCNHSSYKELNNIDAVFFNNFLRFVFEFDEQAIS